MCFSALLATLLGLLTFAGPAAAGAIFSLGVVGQYLATSIPIAARFLGGKKFKPGPFNLGIFVSFLGMLCNYLPYCAPVFEQSLPVAIVAVSWMWFMMVVLLFPTAPDPTAATMNYTVVVLGGILCLAILYFYFPTYGGVHWFHGPVANIDIDGGFPESKGGNGPEKLSIGDGVP